MADITKCEGHHLPGTSGPIPLVCPMRETCWRFKAQASGWQSYMHAPLYHLSDGEWKCDEYWKVKG
jgi:hypothetical protein